MIKTALALLLLVSLPGCSLRGYPDGQDWTGRVPAGQEMVYPEPRYVRSLGQFYKDGKLP